MHVTPSDLLPPSRSPDAASRCLLQRTSIDCDTRAAPPTISQESAWSSNGFSNTLPAYPPGLQNRSWAETHNATPELGSYCGPQKGSILCPLFWDRRSDLDSGVTFRCHAVLGPENGPKPGSNNCHPNAPWNAHDFGTLRNIQTLLGTLTLWRSTFTPRPGVPLISRRKHAQGGPGPPQKFPETCSHVAIY